MASSSTSKSDSLPVSSAVQSTKMLWEPIPTMEKWRWKDFSALHADGSTLHASMHCLWQCPYHNKIASYGPAHYVHPPSTFLDPPLSASMAWPNSIYVTYHAVMSWYDNMSWHKWYGQFRKFCNLKSTNFIEKSELLSSQRDIRMFVRM